ncbi:MAG: hypothetical protein RSD63_03645 [Eubacterium sp.]
MLKKDYLLEMIGAFSRAISQIIFKRSLKEYDKCHAIVNDELQKLMGMPLEIVLSLPAENIFDFLSSFGQLEPEKVLLLVDLLKEEIEVCNDEKNIETANLITLKCEEMLNLLDHYDLDEEIAEQLDKRMSTFGID